MEYSVDPDHLTSEKSADLDLHYFQKRNISGFSVVRVQSEFSTRLLYGIQCSPIITLYLGVQ